MRITARGFRRNAGTTVIADHDLRDASSRVRLHPHEGVTLAHLSDGILIGCGPETIKLAGQYEISVLLTPEDVMRIFLRCFPDQAKLIKGIYEPPKPEAEAAE
jgi:hypothetical protein